MWDLGRQKVADKTEGDIVTSPTKNETNFFSLRARKRFYIPFILIFLMPYITAFISADVQVRHVYGICPVFIITNPIVFNYVKEKNGNPDFLGGQMGILMIINSPISPVVLRHELVHAKQFYRTFGLMIFLGSFDIWRAKFECEAYVTEIDSIDQLPWYADFIKKNYHIDLDVKEVEKILNHYWAKKEH